MIPAVESLLLQFIRSHCTSFSGQDILSGLSAIGMQVTHEEITDYLHMCPLVFSLQDDMFISRAGVFSNMPFAIKPGKSEIDGGYFIPGHRCLPFVDTEIPSGEIRFVYKNVVLPHKIMKFPVAEVLPFFQLYGEEYAMQYLCFDTASAMEPSVCYENEIPHNVKLTVIDMEEIYRNEDFQVGDFFLASVLDWDESIVELRPVCIRKGNPFEVSPVEKARNKWYDFFEAALIKSFTMFGPCSSIEEQLAQTCFMWKDHIGIETCGCIEDCIRNSRMIGIESYGVETRLWFKGQDVPAVGSWIKNKNNGEKGSKFRFIAGSQDYFPVMQLVLDSWILNALFMGEESDEQVLQHLFPEGISLSKENRKKFLHLITGRREQLSESYNRFADFECGMIRRRLLYLYRSISTTASEIDSSRCKLEEIPQQPLVILTQLMQHSEYMMEALLHSEQLSKTDIDAFAASLDGMEFNYEEVSVEISVALKNQRKKKFSVITK